VASALPIQFSHDEATLEDKLDRGRYARALANVARTCSPPFVIGLYGKWGTGKTTLMKLIKQELGSGDNRISSVWFDAWQHQHDDAPALSLMHVFVNTFFKGSKLERGKKLLTIIGTALGSAAMKRLTSIDAKDIQEYGRRYEEEQFQVRDARVRLREYFEALVEEAKMSEGGRIVFFIDDLDRCQPQQTLAVLEALKLYLNLPNCVFFLAVDRGALERGLRSTYKEDQKEGKFDAVGYIDKIIQLPFNIPLIAETGIGKYIDSLLPKELISCRQLLLKGLGGNPRAVKRFINALYLNHLLASESLPGYSTSPEDTKVVAMLLLTQLISPDLYALVAQQPSLIHDLQSKAEETKSLREKYLDPHESLRSVYDDISIPNSIDLKSFIFFTRTAPVIEPAKSPQLRSGAKDLVGAELRGANLSKADLKGASLMLANLSNANLSGSNLERTILQDTNLMGADLRGANLRNAREVTPAALASAITDEKTILPNGMKGPYIPAGTGIMQTAHLPARATYALQQPRFHAVNAAGFSPNSLSPGCLAALFSPRATMVQNVEDSFFPKTLGGVALRIGGELTKDETGSKWIYSPEGSEEAGLMFVGPSQINFQVPPGIVPGDSIAAQLKLPDGRLMHGIFGISPVHPGIFSISRNGRGQGEILNANKTLNSVDNPARPGSVVQIFATGAGDTEPRLAAGAPAPHYGDPVRTKVQPTVSIGGLDARVILSGISPGAVGRWRIEAQIPTNVAPGGEIPLIITAGEKTSNVVTIAIE
jgi:uncharacterized protein (TIGR03437 family)